MPLVAFAHPLYHNFSNTKSKWVQFLSQGAFLFKFDFASILQTVEAQLVITLMSLYYEPHCWQYLFVQGRFLWFGTSPQKV